MFEAIITIEDRCLIIDQIQILKHEFKQIDGGSNNEKIFTSYNSNDTWGFMFIYKGDYW